ncbi:MAG: hypothetical protein U0R51_12910 [Solirubrobacterales bacterium]
MSRNHAFLLVCLLATALAIGVPASADAGADLRIGSVKAAPGQLKPLHVGGTVGKVRLTAKVKNNGDEPTVKHPFAKLSLRGAGELEFGFHASTNFKQIGPGETGTVRLAADPRLGPTTYTPRICVSRSGSQIQRARPSCSDGPDFAAVALTYEGSVSVQLPILGYAKLDSIAGPVFRLDEQASSKRGKFVYKGSGALEHTVSGSSGLCSITGSKSAQIADGSDLVFDKTLQDYSGQISNIDVVGTVQTCNGVPLSLPVRTVPLKIGPISRDPPGLDGPLTGTSTAGGASYKWGLAPG